MYEEEDDGNVSCGGSSVGWYSQSDSVGRRLGGSRGNWVYYDSNGNKVYNDWKKGADGQWRYLDGNGSWRSTPGWTENTM